MRLMQLSFIYLMWLCQFSLAFAQPWHEQIPSALAPFSGQAQQLAKLTGEGILIYSPNRNCYCRPFKNSDLCLHSFIVPPWWYLLRQCKYSKYY